MSHCDDAMTQITSKGVGCKVGIIAVAHTGIIFTLGTTKVRGKDTKTVSIGLISNEPYEKRNEVPITEFVTIMAHNGRPIEGISTKEQKDKLLAKIEKLDSTIDQFFLAQWIAKVQVSYNLRITMTHHHQYNSPHLLRFWLT